LMIAPKLHFLADIADRMEQLNQHDEHDQSSNEENTNDDHQQLLFKYLAESLHKQQQQMQIQMQQQQQNLPLDFSNNIKKEQHQQHSEEEDDDEETDMNDKSPRSMATAAATLPLIPPLLLRNKHGKPTRPFKAYPRDPLSLPLGFYSPLVPSSDNLLNVLASTTSGNNNNNNNVTLPTNDEFSKQFRKRIQQAQERLLNRFQDSPMKNVHSPTSQEKVHSPTSTSTIPPKKRYRPNTPPPEISSSISTHQTTHQENDTKDEAYWERRRKNNEAAKRSRDARRAKEDEIALRAAWLEQENLKLRLENAHLKQENVQLRLQIYGSADLPTPTSQS